MKRLLIALLLVSAWCYYPMQPAQAVGSTGVSCLLGAGVGISSVLAESLPGHPLMAGLWRNAWKDQDVQAWLALSGQGLVADYDRGGWWLGDQFFRVGTFSYPSWAVFYKQGDDPIYGSGQILIGSTAAAPDLYFVWVMDHFHPSLSPMDHCDCAFVVPTSEVDRLTRWTAEEPR